MSSRLHLAVHGRGSCSYQLCTTPCSPAIAEASIAIAAAAAVPLSLPLLTWLPPLPLLPAACSVDDGTLTRTMKPRRAAIMSKYAEEVALLERRLR